MRTRILRLGIVAALVLAFATVVSFAALPASSAQDSDTEVPPGNPVIGSDRPGDTEATQDTNYTLWILLGGCLIAAGGLLVTIERWESRRLDDAERVP